MFSAHDNFLQTNNAVSELWANYTGVVKEHWWSCRAKKYVGTFIYIILWYVHLAIAIVISIRGRGGATLVSLPFNQDLVGISFGYAVSIRRSVYWSMYTGTSAEMIRNDWNILHVPRPRKIALNYTYIIFVYQPFLGLSMSGNGKCVSGIMRSKI